MAVELKKGSVLLRSLEPEDLSFLFRIENDTTIWKVSNTLTPYSKYVLKQYIEQSHIDIYSAKQLRLIIAIDGSPEPIGAIDLFDFEPYHLRAGIGIVIDKQYQGKGYAAIALEILIKYCFEHLNLHQLYCNITVDNVKSIQLFEQAGFIEIGTKKDWIKLSDAFLDEKIYQLIAKRN